MGAGTRAKTEGARVVIVSAAIEAEVAQLPEADRAEFLEGLGLHDSGLDRVIRAGYDLLGLVTFLTVGPKEARAWTIVRGTKAPQAAGTIHGDFERGFIACETIAYDDYVACQGRSRRQGSRQDARRGQGVRRKGRRRPAVPLQRVMPERRNPTALIPNLSLRAAQRRGNLAPVVPGRDCRVAPRVAQLTPTRRPG